jgi:hypothetical protein
MRLAISIVALILLTPTSFAAESLSEIIVAALRDPSTKWTFVMRPGSDGYVEVSSGNVKIVHPDLKPITHTRIYVCGERVDHLFYTSETSNIFDAAAKRWGRDLREESRRKEKPFIEKIQFDKKGASMHYRNGRVAQNGDKIVQIGGYGSGPPEITAVGVLHSAVPGNDHCNGSIAPVQNPATSVCLCDCLHVDDLAELLKNAGLDKRPAGK